MTEADFQRQVTDLCDWLRLKWHHETDSRRSPAGFPDLVICGPGGVIFTELKTERGRVSVKQAGWIAALERGGAEVYLWRPSDLPVITKVLRRLARGKQASA